MLYRANTDMPEPTPDPVPPEATFKQAQDQARDDYDDAHLSLHNFKPHRAPIITGLGIVGILTCWMFGIVGLYFSVKALKMAEVDMKLIHKKEMDPTGLLPIQIGRTFAIFGAITSAVMLLYFLGYAVLIIAAVTGFLGNGWLD